MRLRDLPIKQKLMVITLITSMVALLPMCIALVTYEVITYRSEVVQSTRALARVTAVNTSSSVLFEDARDAQEVLVALAAEPQVLAAAVYDRHGKRFATYIRPEAGGEIPETAWGEGAFFTGSQLHVLQPILERDVLNGTVFISADLWTMYRRLIFYGILVLLVGTAATICALALSSFLNRRISRPITELARVARDVSAQEDYSARAIKYGNDELGQLTEAFNQMLGRIDESRTKLEDSEERLRIAKEIAEAANAAKDNFLAILSHELRTPLTPVLSTVSLLEEDETLTEKAREDLTMIRRNVEVEARLIDDLLDVTRIARGKLELHQQVVNARDLVEHALDNYCSRDASRKCLRVTRKIAAEEVFVLADPSRLTQVFWNVLQNACKFTPDGGTITIGVHNAQRDGSAEPWLCIQVKDSGIGIRHDFLPKIFDAFEQGERSRTRMFGGLGLGLAISRAITELHGGSMKAESEGPGLGATFTILLPTVPAPAWPAHEAVPPKREGEGGAAKKPARRILRILLVEDHADTANQLARLLAHLGHHVTVAGTLGDGLAAAEAVFANGGSLDLILSDLGLPDGSGHDLMRELSQRYQLPGIALSGYGMEEDIQASMAAGFMVHLTKPVDWDALRKVIDDFGEQKQSERVIPTGAGNGREDERDLIAGMETERR